MLPSHLHDEDSMLVWTRAERRGQAQAEAAAAIGCDFIEVRVRRVWARFLPNVSSLEYRGWELETGVLSPCARGAAGATPYFECVYDPPTQRRRRAARAA